MDPDTIADLLAAAQLKSACATAKCRVSGDLHKWFVWIEHLDDTHDCPFHEGGAYPSRFVSIYTLLGQPRETLVTAIAGWLSHLHQPATAVLIGGDGAPCDADPTSSTPFDGSARSGVGSDAIAWDRVGTSPRD